jgi:hypothetical protein
LTRFFENFAKKINSRTKAVDYVKYMGQRAKIRRGLKPRESEDTR